MTVVQAVLSHQRTLFRVYKPLTVVQEDTPLELDHTAVEGVRTDVEGVQTAAEGVHTVVAESHIAVVVDSPVVAYNLVVAEPLIVHFQAPDFVSLNMQKVLKEVI